MIVEDDASLAKWIADYLITQGFIVTVSNRGDEAVDLIRQDMPDLVLLDINLPYKDGFNVCRDVREFYKQPIVMLTARDEEMDEVLGLELGADDYVLKPVRPRALLSRIDKLLQRFSTMAEEITDKHVLIFGGLSIDNASRTVCLKGETIALTSNEFEVLWLLACQAGQVVSRESMISELRGIEYDGFDRSSDIMISRLRKKLRDDVDKPYRIKTVWGKGYLFAQDAW